MIINCDVDGCEFETGHGNILLAAELDNEAVVKLSWDNGCKVGGEVPQIVQLANRVSQVEGTIGFGSLSTSASRDSVLKHNADLNVRGHSSLRHPLSPVDFPY